MQKTAIVLVPEISLTPQMLDRFISRFVKYNPVYAVKINDEIVGYVKSKIAMEEKINNEVLTSDNPCAVFTELNVEPTYELILSDVEAEDDDKIAEVLSENITTMYKVYAVTINNGMETTCFMNGKRNAQWAEGKLKIK